MRVLRELGWVRLLYSTRLQQLGVGNLTGHTDDCGKDQRKTNENNTEVCMADTTQHTQINIVLSPQQNQAHRFLHRMGHSLVSGPQGNLWMYGGLSLTEGILGNVYRYESATTVYKCLDKELVRINFQ